MVAIELENFNLRKMGSKQQ